MWKFKVDGFQTQKHRATKQSSGQEVRRKPKLEPMVSAALDAVLSVEEDRDVNTFTTLPKGHTFVQEFSTKFTQASDEFNSGGSATPSPPISLLTSNGHRRPWAQVCTSHTVTSSFPMTASAAVEGASASGAAAVHSASSDGDIAAYLDFGSILDAESACPARKRRGYCVNPLTNTLLAGSVHNGACVQMVSKALVALQSVRECLETSTDAHSTFDSGDMTMFGEFAAAFCKLITSKLPFSQPCYLRATLELDNVHANYIVLRDIRMRLCNKLAPAHFLLPSSLPYWLFLHALSSPFRSSADRFRRQHTV